MLVPLLQQNLQTVATGPPVVPPVVPPVIASGGGGTYPGYAAERSKKLEQDEQDKQAQPEATRTTQAAPVTQGKASAPVRLDTASQRAMQRSLNAAMKAAQLQALFELRNELIERQAMQAEALQLQINDDDDALIALLLTI